MKPTTIGWVSAALICVVLAGCGDDGETVDSTGVDTTSGGSERTILEFSAPSVNVSEAAGNATVTIVRTGGTGAVSFNITSRNGTANAPQDYTAVSTTLAFAAGETAPKSATIAISDDAIDEPDETFHLTLTVPSAGATLGSTSEVLVTIADDESRLAAPTAAMSAAYKQLHVDWTSVPGANRYRLMKDPTGRDGFSQVGTDLPATATSVDFDVVPLQEDWLNARYLIEACNDAGCTPSNSMSVTGMSVPLIGYLKAANTGEFDRFGYSVSMSDDGNTLAVGAPDENSAARGIGGEQADDCDATESFNCASSAGAVYVYTRSGATWSGPVYVKASNTQAFQNFGFSIALSRDGNTLAVGAPGEGSAATGIGGNPGYSCDIQPFNCASSSGAVYVYTRSGSTWAGPVYVKASNNRPAGSFQPSQRFGFSIALSQDGNMLAVGAPGEGSAGIEGDPNYSCDIRPFNCASSSGAVYVYTRSGATWSGPDYVKASNTQASQLFGSSIALSEDGNTLAAGAPGESSAARGIGGNPDYSCGVGAVPVNCAPSSGAVYVYTRSDSAWSGPVYVKASNTQAFQLFGSSIALSQDGNTLAAGAPGEGSAATGIDGNQVDDCDTTSPVNCAFDSGAAYIYTRSGSTWSDDTVYVKASNTGTSDSFGSTVALNRDGSVLAVGAPDEFGGTAGVASAANDASNDELPGAGAVYLYTRSDLLWTPRQYTKASNPDVDDTFGGSLALNGDGSMLVVGATGEDSASAGFNGNEFDDDCGASQEANCAEDSGAVYVY
jgi:hypothetical protein